MVRAGCWARRPLPRWQTFQVTGRRAQHAGIRIMRCPALRFPHGVTTDSLALTPGCGAPRSGSQPRVA
jgi:hypothetical protein